MNRDHPNYNTPYRQEAYQPPPPADARFGKQQQQQPPFRNMNENGHTSEEYNNGPNVTYNSIGLDEREKRYL